MRSLSIAAASVILVSSLWFLAVGRHAYTEQGQEQAHEKVIIDTIIRLWPRSDTSTESPEGHHILVPNGTLIISVRALTDTEAWRMVGDPYGVATRDEPYPQETYPVRFRFYGYRGMGFVDAEITRTQSTFVIDQPCNSCIYSLENLTWAPRMATSPELSALTQYVHLRIAVRTR